VNITIKTFANIKDVIGTSELSLEVNQGTTIGSLFDLLIKKYGQAFDRQIKDQMTGTIVPFLVLINDTAYRTTTDMGVQLNAGDTVTIMIPFDGG
jgi:MoaD family protein